MSTTNVRFALLCLLLIMLPACAREQRASPTLDAFARDWLEAWDSHDIDRILSFYTEDAFYEDVPVLENGWGVPSRGHQMIREALAEMFEEMSDLGFDFVSASDTGDRMVVEWIMSGTCEITDPARLSCKLRLSDHDLYAEAAGTTLPASEVHRTSQVEFDASPLRPDHDLRKTPGYSP